METEVEMIFTQLRELHQERPFQPFSMYLADGGKIHVSHPETLAYGSSGKTVVVVLPDDQTQFVDLLGVSRIELGDSVKHRQKPAT